MGGIQTGENVGVGDAKKNGKKINAFAKSV